MPSLVIEIVRRSDHAKGFVVEPMRWIVERTIGWLGRCRQATPRIGRTATTTLSPSFASRPSASCSESYAILYEVSGRTLRVQEIHTGAKSPPPFSAADMTRRMNGLRGILAEQKLDAAILTSYHNICYFSGFLYCSFGRRYALVVTDRDATLVSAAIDTGQPWRRSVTTNITYTDWRRDNYLYALQSLLACRRDGLVSSRTRSVSTCTASSRRRSPMRASLTSACQPCGCARSSRPRRSR